jgi:PPOX class probable F420-dependent enzyme
MFVDTTTEFGQRVEKRLRNDPVIWLVTVGQDGRPIPSPVWFHWDGVIFLIYSQPGTLKLRNIKSNPHVALHFDSEDRTGRGGHDGENIVIVSGTAQIDPHAELGETNQAFIAKYRDTGRCDAWGVSYEELAREFSVAIRITRPVCVAVDSDREHPISCTAAGCKRRTPAYRRAPMMVLAQGVEP